MQLLWKPVIKILVDTKDQIPVERAAGSNDIEILLFNLDMRPGLKLQDPLLRRTGIITGQCTLDVHRPGVMTFDQVRVITVHAADKRPYRFGSNRVHGSRKLGGLNGNGVADLIERIVRLDE